MVSQLLGLFDAVTAARYRRTAALAVAYSVFEGISFSLLLPVIAAVIDDDISALAMWISMLTISSIITITLRVVLSETALRTTILAINVLHRRIAHHLAALPTDWFTSAHIGNLAYAAWPGAADVTKTVLLGLQPLLRGVVTPLVVAAAVGFVDIRLSAVIVVCGVTLWFCYKPGATTLDRAEEKSHKAQADSVARIIEFAEAQPTLRSTGRMGLGRVLLERDLAERERLQADGVLRELVARAGFMSAVNICIAILAAAVVLVAAGQADTAMLAAVLTIILRFVEPIGAASETARAMRGTRATLRRLTDLFAVPTLSMPASPITLPTVRPDQGRDITIEEVDFSYAGSSDTSALRSINLTIPAGSMTAIVGPSGAGKTTLLRMILRFSDPQCGCIRLSGIDVRNLALGELYAGIGAVLQDIVLLDGSIRDNVLLGRPGASEEEMLSAAGLSGLAGVIAQLPDGWNTQVGSGGNALSGGERQRVSLARVILQDPSVVVLDEATAALDSVSDHIVRKWIRSVTGRKTVILVAHRLNSVVDADQIIVMDDGRIVERGNHRELRSAAGVYQHLWDTYRSEKPTAEK